MTEQMSTQDMQYELRRLRDREQILLQLQDGEHVQRDVELLAHCGQVLTCSDEQIPVIGTRTVTAQTYGKNGDDGPTAHMIERSWTDLDFQNDEDRTCKKCGGHMHLTDQVRPVYGPLSGHAQSGLVDLAKKVLATGVKPTPEAIHQEAISQAAQPTPEDDRVDALMREFEELKATISEAFQGAATPAAAVPEPSGVKGYRKRGERYEALIYKSESKDGRQHGVGHFDSAEEAVAAREAWLAS